MHTMHRLSCLFLLLSLFTANQSVLAAQSDSTFATLRLGGYQYSVSDVKGIHNGACVQALVGGFVTPNFIAGVGLGYEGSSLYKLFPLYFELRREFMKGSSLSGFGYFDLGFGFPEKGSRSKAAFAQLGAGARHRLSRNSSLTVELGLKVIPQYILTRSFSISLNKTDDTTQGEHVGHYIGVPCLIIGFAN